MAYLMTQAGAAKLQPTGTTNPMRPGGTAPANAVYLENGRLKSAATPPPGARLVARTA